MKTLKKVMIGSFVFGVLCIMASACGQNDENVADQGNTVVEQDMETVSEETQIVEEKAPFNTEPDYSGIKKGSNNAKVSVHDPSIEVFNGKYYIYGSHMTAAVSEDMSSWKWIGNGYSAGNKTFGKIFSNIEGYAYSGLGSSLITTDDGGNHVWAPDVIYNPTMGKYCMYYCYSSTWNASNLALAVSDTPEGPFEFVAPLVYSGFTARQVKSTDVFSVVDEEWAVDRYYSPSGGYNYQQFPNAIDPAPFYDADGRLWMVYGSWSGGIFLLELDVNTGLVIHPEADTENDVDPYFGKRLCGGNHKSIEGPYIQYSAKTGYYYLFLSYGGLTQKGGYQIRVLRSDKPDGVYTDLNGERPNRNGNHAQYGVKLSGNYTLPSLSTGYMATGGQSCFTDTDGKEYICYHTRFESKGEYHEPCIKQILYNEDAWPVLLPYKTAGETVSESGYDMTELVGDYFFVNNGSKIDSTVVQPTMIRLNADGTVEGIEAGTWTKKDGTYYMSISLGNAVFKGVFCKQVDSTGVEIMAFSAIGGSDGLQSVWGVKY